MQKIPMEILFSRHSLQILLNAKKSKICNNRGEGIAIIFAAVAFVLPVVYTSMPTWAKCACTVIAIIYAIYGVTKIMNGYTIDNLENDILALNEIASRHSIIVIRDTFNEYASRFLVYYDSRWDCYLFPNYKTAEHDNEQSIIKHLSCDLHVPEDSMEIDYRITNFHRKHSVSNNREKLYEHALYVASFDVPADEQSAEFTVAGRKYKWMTYDELLADKRVQDVNLDIVSWVHDLAI